MPTGTYETIATTTLASASATIVFNTFSSTFTDLVIITQPIGSTTNFLAIQFNGDTSSNYSRNVISGNGSAPVSDQRTSRTSIELDYNESIGTGYNYNSQLHIFGANSTDFYKNVFAKPNGSGYGSAAHAYGLAHGTWRSTSAITSITLLTSSGTFATGTRASLYGIKAGS